MTQKSVEMNLVKQVYQLKKEGVPIKEIVRRIGISRNTVKKYLRRMEELLQEIDSGKAIDVPDKQLAVIIYNNDTAPVAGKPFEQLATHFDYAKRELYKTGVNKQILWMEYLEQYPDGYRYSQYCNLFKKYLKDTDPAFHWEYDPGEFTQIDFAGKHLSYVNKETGEVIECEIFVAVLPFSGLIFCAAVHSQQTEDFAHCINQMVKYYGGLTKTILCDNLKTAVTKADKHEPIFTDLCHQLSEHYNTTFSATRPYSPRDKGMVENAVNIVYTNIYAPLRNVVSGSFEELNCNIRKYLDILNLKAYKGNAESRRDIYAREEQSLLKPLPETPYLVKRCRQVTVQQNYYIMLPDNRHYYSVPYQHIGHLVRAYYNHRTLEVYYNYERIAFHVRSSTEPKYNRINEHIPAEHLYMIKMKGWTVEGFLEKAERIGPYARQAADRILHSSFYADQNFKTCNAMILLQKKYSKERLEAACHRAANVKRPTLSLIKTILAKGLDKQPLLFDEEDDSKIPPHENIRGSDNYK